MILSCYKIMSLTYFKNTILTRIKHISVKVKNHRDNPRDHMLNKSMSPILCMCLPSVYQKFRALWAPLSSTCICMYVTIFTSTSNSNNSTNFLARKLLKPLLQSVCSQLDRRPQNLWGQKAPQQMARRASPKPTTGARKRGLQGPEFLVQYTLLYSTLI